MHLSKSQSQTDIIYKYITGIAMPLGPSNRSNSVSSLDLEGESVSELGAGPSGSNGVEALQLLEHEQGVLVVPEHCTEGMNRYFYDAATFNKVKPLMSPPLFNKCHL